MDNEKIIRRSKIYTYFYGRNKWLQLFIIIAGVLLILFSSTVGAAMTEVNRNRLSDLREQYWEARSEYDELFDAARSTFKPEYGKEVEAKRGEDYFKEKKAYNEALEAIDKAEEKLEKQEEKDLDKNFLSSLLRILGIVAVIAGLGWIIYKNATFNKEGQEEYDLELQERIAAAKQKGLEKLNLAAEQIDRIEPVVLNGVANMENTGMKASGGGRNRLLSVGILLLGVIVSVVLNVIFGLLARNLFMVILLTLLILGGLGAAGYFLYQKFEVESYVFPKTFETLSMLPPQMITKVGSDERIRVSLPAITVYMFGEEQLYMYYQYLDIVTGLVFFEGVHEYFYEDIVGVASSQETKRLYERTGGKGSEVKCIEYLRESISVVTSGCTYTESFIVDVGNSLLDTSFLGMRNLIRQKKEGNRAE